MQSNHHLLQRVWLKTLNLALVGGTPHYFTCYLMLALCFSGQMSTIQVWGSVTVHMVLYFWIHWGQCSILVWEWGRHFY
jgi:hypothetical protein